VAYLIFFFFERLEKPRILWIVGSSVDYKCRRLPLHQTAQLFCHLNLNFTLEAEDIQQYHMWGMVSARRYRP
jgi:hypothetical protein